MELTEEIARNFSRIALGHVTREYPHKLDHVMMSDADVLSPRTLHPVFYGSYDWHSCVHSWWTLLTLRRLYPDTPEAAEICKLANETFTPEKIAVELAYLERPSSRGFERPYGWGWLLYLHHEACRHIDQLWGERLEPLANKFVEMFDGYIRLLTYPITVGTHYNSAFALTLAREWAGERDLVLQKSIDSWTLAVFEDCSDYRGWEPGGDEFLSPALVTALLMSRVQEPVKFAHWFDRFLPETRIEKLFEPVTVSDRSDGKIAHLDGLNLSRAWCLKQIARRLETGHRAESMFGTADKHLQAGMPRIAGDYMGEHWLASFALLALLDD